MAEGYKQPILEAENKIKKIEDYFSGQKIQKPEIEKMQKPEAIAGNSDILKLEKELSLTREQYVSANFETDSALIKIKKFLHVKEDLSDRGALDLKCSRYKNKLNELLSLKIDELKSRNLGKDKIGKAMNDLVEKFNLDEEASLCDARAKFGLQNKEIPKDHKQVKSENIKLESKSLPKPAKINFDSIFRGDAGRATELFRSVIVLGGKWEDIKNMTFGEAARELNWRADKKIENICKCLKKKLGDDAKPGDGETVEKWTERVAELAVEKNK